MFHSLAAQSPHFSNRHATDLLLHHVDLNAARSKKPENQYRLCLADPVTPSHRLRRGGSVGAQRHDAKARHTRGQDMCRDDEKTRGVGWERGGGTAVR